VRSAIFPKSSADTFFLDLVPDIPLQLYSTIMMRDNEAKLWRVACRPCAKFFNQQETHCPVFEKKAFDTNCDEYVLVEKAGS
jgi:hypothetical protein